MQEFWRSSSPEILKLFLAKENMLKQNVSEKPNRQNSRSRAAPGGLEGGGGVSERALCGTDGTPPPHLQTNSRGPKVVQSQGQGHTPEPDLRSSIRSPHHTRVLLFLPSTKELVFLKSPRHRYTKLLWQVSHYDLITCMAV